MAGRATSWSDSLLVINRKGRLGYFQDDRARPTAQELRLQRGLVEARVRTAVPLAGDAADAARLSASITRFSGLARRILSEKCRSVADRRTIVEVEKAARWRWPRRRASRA